MLKSILNTFDDLFTVLFVIAATFLFMGCDAVTIEEKVVYIDGSPVAGAKVHQWTDEGYDGYTYTDGNGTWFLTVPPDSIIYLCIENPKDDNLLACYEEGFLVTPAVESGETEMIRIEK